MRVWNLLPLGITFGLLQVALRMTNDGDLVRRLKAREPKAMADLYDRYGRIAYSVILRVVRNAAIAEDLAQETFMRVWNRMDSFDAERGALGTWILTVARNRAIDYLRSVDGRMQAGTVELERLERPGFFSNMDTGALSLDRIRRLKEAFERLSPHQRTVIELAYYEGLSQTEVADRLNQPLGTVKTWTRGALKVLREELREAAVA